MHEITRIQQKYMILRELFVKVIIFQFLKATAINFDKYAARKIFERTFRKNT